MPSAQPLHRRWLHAMEDDITIPAHVMQVARVYADFGAKSLDGKVHVSWRMLRRCTHLRNDRIAQSLTWMVEHRWLAEEPFKRGQRKYYRLVSAPVDVSAWTRPDRSRSREHFRSRSREHERLRS